MCDPDPSPEKAKSSWTAPRLKVIDVYDTAGSGGAGSDFASETS